MDGLPPEAEWHCAIRYKSSFREALYCGLSATIAGRCQYEILPSIIVSAFQIRMAN
jgi:hypothetical protein